jgi:hypothetical protein
MADWTVEVTTKPGASALEDHIALRHSDQVVQRITDLANKIVQASGSPDDFEVLVQNETETMRPRAFAKPRTGKGIRLELQDSVLIKGAASMGGS